MDITQLKSIFSDIYKGDLWSMGQQESKSGLGSSLKYTQNIRETLLKVVNEYNIKNIVDTSCGDWYWMKLIRDKLPCKYVGIDIVSDLIENNTKKYGNENTIFVCGDFLSVLRSLSDKSVDLLLCRHTCEHLPTEYVLEFIKEAKRVSKFLLLTTKTTDNASPVNRDLVLTETPYRPINLFLHPYSLLLNEYLIEKIYDGPCDIKDPEMYINFYKFI